MEFSVLLSVYFKDNPKFLRDSLCSLKNQTLKANEIVLVKDGPLSSELESVITEFTSKLPLKIISIKENRGLGHALAFGLNLTSNEIVARMDADDIAVPNRFEKQINFLLKNPNYDVVGCNVEEFNKIPGDLKRIKSVPEHHDEIVEFSKKRNPINHPTVMFKKSLVLQSGSYEDFQYFEDYYLWAKMIISKCFFYNIQEPLLFFRVGNDMIGRRHGYHYSKLEYRFFKKLYLINYISYCQLLINLILRLPLRLIPKQILNLFYSKLLRV